MVTALAFWATMFSWLPSPISEVLAGLLALFVIFLVVRIVTLVLDALPFL